ncbi:MAG: diguanylate cyclase [Deltaproteobacteria bacterium]|nr:diguanylate cyclase [Deltaproteobacteria bacterium]
MNDQRIKVVLGENPETSDGSVKRILEKRNAILFPCSDGLEAIRICFSKGPDLIILDADLPCMNGYQCSRVLKHDALTRDIPILHLGTSATPLDRYWSRVCQADGYLRLPAEESELETAIEGALHRGTPRRRLLPRVSLVSGLEDRDIISLATHLLEHDLLMSSVLNEINRIEDRSGSSKELIASLLAIIHSLFPFSYGAALLMFEKHTELYMRPGGDHGSSLPERIQSLIRDHLRDRHGCFLKPDNVTTVFIDPAPGEALGSNSGDVFLHTRTRGPVRSVLAFENLNPETLPREEQDVLHLALETAHSVMEKKILSITTQELSVIDETTRGYSMMFFKEVLGRELANARRNHFPVTLFTLFISNFGDLIAGLSPEDRPGLLESIHGAILQSMRKSDIIARLSQADFVFLLTYTSRENAAIPAARVKAKIVEDVAEVCPGLGPLVISMGVSEFDPDRHPTPEAFLNEGMPGKSPALNGDPSLSERNPAGEIG